MGSKNQPGKFDCYNAAEPDEPLFALLARDPLAGHLVSIWSAIRMGDPEKAEAVFQNLMLKHGRRYGAESDVEKASEAMDCSMAMFEWRKKNRPD